MNRMEIICVGNELLIGKTLNTNGNWLAKRATTFGIRVKRITVVGDEIDEVAQAVREALQRKAGVIITTGGLGPTFDDRTLEGIAVALNRRLEVNQEALEMIRERYQTYVEEGKMERVEFTPARIKMAKLPRGSQPLPNPVGTAPGAKINIQGTLLIALPGVPPEMETIFEESVTPLLQKIGDENKYFEASIYCHGIIESALAPLIDQAMHDNPHVYIKSHVYSKPHRSTGKGIEFHLSTTSKDPETAKNRFGTVIDQLTELVKQKGGKIKLKKREQ